MSKRLTIAASVLLAGVTAALAQSTNVLGPSMTTVTATSVAATMAALGSNPSRKQLTICNGSATATATFTTGPSLTPVNLTTGVVLQTGNVASSCFTLGTGGKDGPAVGAQINVIASTAGTPITFVEYF